MMKDYEDWSWTPGRSYLSMNPWGDRQYREGVFRHKLGVVEVYEQVGPGRLSLRFRFEGRDYCRTWKTTFGDKTIARLAREFIEDVSR